MTDATKGVYLGADQKQLRSRRACVICGGTIPLGADHYMTRRTCGGACRYKLVSEAKRKTVAARSCVVCGGSILRPPGMSPGRYEARTTCGRSCQARLLGEQKCQSCPEKPCLICGVLFARRANENGNAFRSRQTCGNPACRVAQTTIARRQRSEAKATGKACRVCERRFFLRAGEQPWAFQRRVTCSVECSYVYRIAVRYGAKRHSSYPLGWPAVRAAIRKRDGYSCRLCGVQEAGRAHAVHHIDYDKKHCHPTNLITLCGCCHGRTNADRDEWRVALTELMAA
jgi:5-methylcytosine-specific restriction endonuclease McrA